MSKLPAVVQRWCADIEECSKSKRDNAQKVAFDRVLEGSRKIAKAGELKALWELLSKGPKKLDGDALTNRLLGTLERALYGPDEKWRQGLTDAQRRKWQSDVVSAANKLSKLVAGTELDNYLLFCYGQHWDKLERSLAPSEVEAVRKASMLLSAHQDHEDPPFLTELLDRFVAAVPSMLDETKPLSNRPNRPESARIYFVRYVHQDFFMFVLGKPHFEHIATLANVLYEIPGSTLTAEKTRRMCAKDKPTVSPKK